ncbi:sel1 repeat family protein [Dyella caseinilytica]|uniref:Sel1 repeat family protein n=1 Tax=Dyella caseinilytica TaxID=1849581 RepID=A0ABX7GYW1_9GAMM|nr:sel1 repeat family protein [Dyella caseinilytica]
MCTHEADHLPPLDPDADQLFKYARYLEKKSGPKDFNVVARYYRIAAAHSHYKANHNLQVLVSEGVADSPSRPNETIALVEQLIKDGIPGGYYDMGYYLEQGYGVRQDQELAWRYYRKAADLGSPEGQYYVGDKLTSAKDADAYKVGWQMYRCAAAQGHGQAAEMLGINFQIAKHYAEAAQAFQWGAAAGDSLSTSFLEKGFEAPTSSDELNYLALPSDPERSRRYKLIGQFIDHNDGHNPKVPDIDKIVPLPPAQLPEWDGTFQWQKEQEQIPPKPSDELIQRMAKGKNLDPATGLPIPPPPKTALGTRVKTGERCPESGDWCAWLTPTYRVAYFQRSLRKGDIMPTYMLSKPRRFGLLDDMFGMRHEEVVVKWELVRYADTV